MRVLLVDDETLAIDRLRTLLADVEGVTIVGEAGDGESALALIGETLPDLVILDVQMPGRNGLRTAGAITVDPAPEIVFITAHEHYAPDAFDLDAADYILKPVRFERLRQAIDRARKRRMLNRTADRVEALESQLAALRGGAVAGGGDPEFWVPSRHGQVRVPLESIDWIEAARDYVLLHTALRSFMLRTTMTALEEKLTGTPLVRVHRSAFVRPARVSEVRRDGRSVTLMLADGASVQVGPSYVSTIETVLGLSR
ncbi:LytTR family DNA-binding domain-containing protein [Sphingomonas naphthae]|uniref:LytTR family DNA-binding domain-containing protein n=1 Tax=Sphingomonas naphthae TaxID=1813468 RepID=A0ABY7TQZ8_9SPHN|nr:LytTR family DNA-binding domain-containing protein [Sphingomonas naphthae]WCT75101.1 LytTR family DNA-binding domain-containing protein [Sphingomonas naphthae]